MLTASPTTPAAWPSWFEPELSAWRPPDTIRVSQWAEKHRVLTRRQSSRPGPWRNENAPPLAVVMDLCIRPGVNELWIKKCGQAGVSEALRNAIAWWAINDPDPLLLVLPDEEQGRKIFRKRILPLFEDTPALAALLTGKTRDKKLTGVTLANGFDLQLAWSGSPSSLASDPIRRAIMDETDKFVEYTGKEAAPIDLARIRLTTYKERSLLVAISTPTLDNGQISVGFEDCPTKLYFFAACPHCRTVQRMAHGQLRWEKFKELPDAKARAARIEARNAAWYECSAPSCGKRIEESHKRAMLCGGFFGTEDLSWKLYCDGREEGEQPEGNKVGIHYPGIIDLSVTYAKIAAELVAADGRPAETQNVHNSRLGEAFKVQVDSPTVNVFQKKCRPDEESGFVPAPAKVVPAWASRLVMAVDTQLDHFYYVIRAFGFNLRSQRIHHGKAMSFEELEELYYRAHWPYEGNKYAPLRCAGSAAMGIDSGGGMGGTRNDANRTAQVYQWCLKDPIWRLPLKGASKAFEQRIRVTRVTYQDPNKEREPIVVNLHLIDGLYFRDILASQVKGRVPVVDAGAGEVTGEADQWLCNDFDDPDYNRHLGAMHKVRRKGIEVWEPRTAGARHDFNDVEAYIQALAHGPAKCFALPSPEQFERQMKAASAMHNAAPSGGGVRMPDGRKFLASQRK